MPVLAQAKRKIDRFTGENLLRAAAMSHGKGRIVITRRGILDHRGKVSTVNWKVLEEIPRTKKELAQRLGALELEKRESEFLSSLMSRTRAYYLLALNAKTAAQIVSLNQSHGKQVYADLVQNKLSSQIAKRFKALLSYFEPTRDRKTIQRVFSKLLADLGEIEKENSAHSQEIAMEAEFLQGIKPGQENLSPNELSKLYSFYSANPKK